MTSSQQSARKVAGAVRHRLLMSIDMFRMQERSIIQKALSFAEEKYEKYRKKTRTFPERGVPLIVHPMRVALVLIEELELKDTGAICSALLHELVEWPTANVTIADIERMFGRPIAMLVSILTKPPLAEELSEEDRATRMNIYYRRIEQASVVSKLVKLCDRLDSVREAPDWLEDDAQKRYLEETKTVYLPLAQATDAYLFEEISAACEQLQAFIDAPVKSTSSLDQLYSVEGLSDSHDDD